MHERVNGRSALHRPLVSVLMPTYNRAPFIARALASLRAQQFTAWELVVVDDGSTDTTPSLLEQWAGLDPRFRIVRLEHNGGMGAALNAGLDRARAPLVAYLPSDDVWYPQHLASLHRALAAAPDAVLAYSGLRHHYNRVTPGPADDGWLQPVQVLHRMTTERWLERSQLVTDDLDRMFWDALRRHGNQVGSGGVTCEWVDHPDQRHKLLREPEGGINLYRQRFGVAHPLRFHTSRGNCIDEPSRYRRFRERPPTPRAPDGLRIVLAGELAYNAERVLALEERGHELHGLWMPDPYWYNTVGPVPFGHVRDLPGKGWEKALEALRPDVIYALLNWQAVPFCDEVRAVAARLSIPFVWHFKEGPFICLEKGTWPALLRLHEKADGIVYSSEEMRAWFESALSPGSRSHPTLVLDGDLPKREWLAGSPSPLLSDMDGEIHTVVSGRPIGLHPETVADLARRGVHLHFYGSFTQGQWKAWIEKARGMAPRHLHLHEQVDQDGWVREFSAYDAAWLHVFESGNGGDVTRATWDDLNLPARMATYAAAGLPMIQRRNDGAVVATERLARELDVGLYFGDLDDLAAQLRDGARLAALRANAWRHRQYFTFDAHADRLIAFFRRVVAMSAGR